VVTKGVTIGNHCLIGAGAVVTFDVDDYTIAGDVPAEPIRRVEIDQHGEIHLNYKNF